ncbi:hypothetical protein N7537_003985 [Penicillium hordei]|uniref:Xylanolytic transcriptional activator regulatory domain-containing protein n=1 Tax=Penicillium hordei TaxID=40994 RepID=A0AAD6EAG8_9EURO|nr:uncharacterized protein N7537_003985 [Penicillium hordei]KAJ5607366.1 hypothetical protein N7537_003985 [Penicillium hordei]
MRLEAACTGSSSVGPLPHGLLACAVGHSIPNSPDLQPHLQKIWTHVINGLEDEFRTPRLATLQVAILAIASRPCENIGQRDVLVSKSVAVAYLLGLHMDPARWELPIWERSLRKRLWWTLFIFDKWRALVYGRPSFIHSTEWHVSIPKVEDCDWGRYAAPELIVSFKAFIYMCRMTQIVDSVVQSFMSVKSLLDPPAPFVKVALLEDVNMKLATVEEEMPESFKWNGTAAEGSTMPTGVRSAQLSMLGLRIIVYRLHLNVAYRNIPLQYNSVAHIANDICKDMADFLDILTGPDLQLFWFPYTADHISNCGSLLLRIAIRGKATHTTEGITAEQLVRRLVDRLIELYETHQWDIAEAALRRLDPPLLAARKTLDSADIIHRKIASTMSWNSSGAFPQSPHAEAGHPGEEPGNTDLSFSMGLNNGLGSSWAPESVIWEFPGWGSDEGIPGGHPV